MSDKKNLNSAVTELDDDALENVTGGVSMAIRPQNLHTHSPQGLKPMGSDGLAPKGPDGSILSATEDPVATFSPLTPFLSNHDKSVV